MDKRIEKKSMKKWLAPAVVAACTIGVVAPMYFFSSSSVAGQSQQLSFKSVMTSTVVRGQFADTLSVRGTVSPKTTVYMDAVAGGRVEERLVVQGELVEKGQSLVRLSNTALQLDVITREAQISEQMNILRNTQMQSQSNRLNLRRNLLDNDNQIAHLKRKIHQSVSLVKRGGLSQEELAEMKQDLSYYQGLNVLTKERQKQEDDIRVVQIKQLEESAAMLQENLKFARSNLDNLLIKAPVSGYLSELNIELGESKELGSRLGQIDIPGEFKVVVSLDEYYLNQVFLGMGTHLELGGKQYPSTIIKVDSRVNNGQFQIEVDVPTELIATSDNDKTTGKGIKRGQSIELALVMGEGSNDALMIDRGAYVSSTGGNWIFVLNKRSNTAQRRPIKLGKKNQQYSEVLMGLEEGEVVITSNYSSFDKADTLNF